MIIRHPRPHYQRWMCPQPPVYLHTSSPRQVICSRRPCVESLGLWSLGIEQLVYGYHMTMECLRLGPCTWQEYLSFICQSIHACTCMFVCPACLAINCISEYLRHQADLYASRDNSSDNTSKIKMIRSVGAHPCSFHPPSKRIILSVLTQLPGGSPLLPPPHIQTPSR